MKKAGIRAGWQIGPESYMLSGMKKGWKIISTTARLGGGAPLKEYFLVAIADPDEAIKALQKRENLLDAEITLVGEASDELVERLDVRPGEILCVLAAS